MPRRSTRHRRGARRLTFRPSYEPARKSSSAVLRPGNGVRSGLVQSGPSDVPEQPGGSEPSRLPVRSGLARHWIAAAEVQSVAFSRDGRGIHNNTSRGRNPECFWPRLGQQFLRPPADRGSVTEHLRISAKLLEVASIPTQFIAGHYLKKVRVPGMTEDRARQYLKDLKYATRMVMSNLIACRRSYFLAHLLKWQEAFVLNGPWAFLKSRRPPKGLIRDLMKHWIASYKSFWCVDSRHPVKALQTPLRIVWNVLKSDLIDRSFEVTKTRIA